MDGETTLTGIIIEEAIGIHRQYGPGMLESAYEQLLAHRLRRRGLTVRRQVPVPLEDDGLLIKVAYRADMVVEESVVVECKSTSAPDPLHGSQLLTHLRLLHLEVGLALNFGQKTLRTGLKRVVNTHPSALPAPPRPPRTRNGERRSDTEFRAPRRAPPPGTSRPAAPGTC